MVARPGEGNLTQRAVSEKRLDLVFIEIIGSAALMTERKAKRRRSLCRALRSWRKARKGAMPVPPGPTMMIGVSSLSGSAKIMRLLDIGLDGGPGMRGAR